MGCGASREEAPAAPPPAAAIEKHLTQDIGLAEWRDQQAESQSDRRYAATAATPPPAQKRPSRGMTQGQFSGKANDQAPADVIDEVRPPEDTSVDPLDRPAVTMEHHFHRPPRANHELPLDELTTDEVAEALKHAKKVMEMATGAAFHAAGDVGKDAKGALKDASSIDLRSYHRDFAHVRTSREICAQTADTRASACTAPKEAARQKRLARRARSRFGLLGNAIHVGALGEGWAAAQAQQRLEVPVAKAIKAGEAASLAAEKQVRHLFACCAVLLNTVR
eukprot:COSAG04_NODE_56_length_30604_cov_692.571119_17_plen_279_part_00